MGTYILKTFEDLFKEEVRLRPQSKYEVHENRFMIDFTLVWYSDQLEVINTDMQLDVWMVEPTEGAKVNHQYVIDFTFTGGFKEQFCHHYTSLMKKFADKEFK